MERKRNIIEKLIGKRQIRKQISEKAIITKDYIGKGTILKTSKELELQVL